jgi:hypothetical protein
MTNAFSSLGLWGGLVASHQWQDTGAYGCYTTLLHNLVAAGKVSVCKRIDASEETRRLTWSCSKRLANQLDPHSA